MPLVAFAQQADADTERPSEQIFELREFGLSLAKPDGWIIRESARGVVATFRAVGEPTSQIEVRASRNIPAAQSSSFFASFHTQLRRTGFVEVSELQDMAYGEFRGRQTEYEITSGGERFRLVVWQFHRNDTAWMFVGFFPRARRQTHITTFESLIKTMKFQ